MKERTKGFLGGVIAAAVLAGTVGTAAATIGSRMIQADYTNIKITLNGQQITPKDATGAEVEPFAVSGTTYLPVRAVANALGIGVDWDDSTSTVVLTGNDETATYFELYMLMDYTEFYQEGVELLASMIAYSSPTQQILQRIESLDQVSGNWVRDAAVLAVKCSEGTAKEAYSQIFQAKYILDDILGSMKLGTIPSDYSTKIMQADNYLIQAGASIKSAYYS